MVNLGVARIPEDRHAEGLISDMSITENVISESYRSAEFAAHGFISWKKARGFALKIITAYEVKCPSPEARVRLLSGGNMQKLILGRVMAKSPAWFWPTSRPAGWMWGPSIMCMSNCWRRANGAPPFC